MTTLTLVSALLAFLFGTVGTGVTLYFTSITKITAIATEIHALRSEISLKNEYLSEKIKGNEKNLMELKELNKVNEKSLQHIEVEFAKYIKNGT